MYGVSCLAMLANFLSGLELPAREKVLLGAAETNEMSAPGHSFFPGHPMAGALYLERRPGLTITGELQSPVCSALHSSQQPISTIRLGGRKGSSAREGE